MPDIVRFDFANALVSRTNLRINRSQPTEMERCQESKPSTLKMQPANILGTATATIKHESLIGAKLMLVQPLLDNGEPDGFPMLAVDGVGSGPGETVMITSDGRFGRKLLNHNNNPVRWTIVGIKDQ